MRLAVKGLQGLVLDGDPRLGETVEDVVDHFRKVLGHSAGEAGTRSSRRQGKLPRNVVNVGLGRQKQCGRDIAELDVVTARTLPPRFTPPQASSSASLPWRG